MTRIPMRQALEASALVSALATGAMSLAHCADSYADPIVYGPTEDAGASTLEGAATLEAAAEADAPAHWCAEQSPTPLLCEDFDIPGEATPWLSLGPMASGSLDTTSFTSPPASLLVSAGNYAFYGANAPLPANLASVHLEYDLFLESLPGSMISHQLRLENPGQPAYLLQLFLQSGDGYAVSETEGSDAGGVSQLLASSPAVGAWSHVEDDVAFSPPTRTVRVNGQVVVSAPLDSGWMRGTSINLQLGIAYAQGSAPVVLRVDDVLVRVTPGADGGP
jgi:hypothetical protein